jgi:membrane-associated protease RseP (regulator of RpoE activity)
MLNVTLPMKIATLGLLTACGLLLSEVGPPFSSSQRRSDSKAPTRVAMQESSTKAPETNAQPDRGWIGVMLEDSNGQGARVVDVFPGGPAAFAGVRKGDILTRIGGASVTSAADATSAVERLAPRQQTTMTIDRRGKTLELKLNPESLADFRERYITEMMRRDPRHPKYAEHPGISESDMQAEVVRRLFEQHERLERSLNEVLKELHELRQEVRALKK